jgi:hypothetical protein
VLACQRLPHVLIQAKQQQSSHWSL